MEFLFKMSIHKPPIHVSWDRARYMFYSGIISAREWDWYVFLWTWGAPRFSDPANAKQFRCSQKIGYDGLQRRFARVRKIMEQFDNVKPPKTLVTNDRVWTIPIGYMHVLWIDVRKGDQVWLLGTYEDKPVAYGPHTVVDPATKTLVNSKGRIFLHYPEDLLVEHEAK